MKKSNHFLRKILAALLVLAIVLPYGFSQSQADSSYPHEQEIWDASMQRLSTLKLSPALALSVTISIWTCKAKRTKQF